VIGSKKQIMKINLCKQNRNENKYTKQFAQQSILEMSTKQENKLHRTQNKIKIKIKIK